MKNVYLSVDETSDHVTRVGCRTRLDYCNTAQSAVQNGVFARQLVINVTHKEVLVMFQPQFAGLSLSK